MMDKKVQQKRGRGEVMYLYLVLGGAVLFLMLTILLGRWGYIAKKCKRVEKKIVDIICELRNESWRSKYEQKRREQIRRLNDLRRCLFSQKDKFKEHVKKHKKILHERQFYERYSVVYLEVLDEKIESTKKTKGKRKKGKQYRFIENDIQRKCTIACKIEENIQLENAFEEYAYYRKPAMAELIVFIFYSLFCYLGVTILVTSVQEKFWTSVLFWIMFFLTPLIMCLVFIGSFCFGKGIPISFGKYRTQIGWLFSPWKYYNPRKRLVILMTSGFSFYIFFIVKAISNHRCFFSLELLLGCILLFMNIGLWILVKEKQEELLFAESRFERLQSYSEQKSTAYLSELDDLIEMLNDNISESTYQSYWDFAILIKCLSAPLTYDGKIDIERITAVNRAIKDATDKMNEIEGEVKS